MGILQPLPAWPFGDIKPRGFHGLLVDPPWSFRLRSDAGEKKSPQAQYAVMDLDALAALPVGDLAAEPAMIFMWATAPLLPQQIAVMEAWGFRYVTAGAWAKQSRTGRSWTFGTGYVMRSAAEFFVIGVRGSPVYRSRSVRNLIVAPVREHSRKPDAARAMVEALIPRPYIELFARTRAPGWTAWGDDVERFA